MPSKKKQKKSEYIIRILTLTVLFKVIIYFTHFFNNLFYNLVIITLSWIGAWNIMKWLDKKIKK